MKIQKMQIFDDEIVVNFTDKKTSFLGIIVVVIIFVGVIGLSAFLGGRYDYLFHSNISVLVGFLIGFFLVRSLNFLQSKMQNTIVFNKKYVVVYDNFCQGRVYKMENIRNWCINPNYRLTVWTHICAFFTKGAGGCIAFNYADIKVPLQIGYGLTTNEAEELLEAIREKGWISDFQRSETALEYKKGKIMKFVMWFFLVLLTIGLIEMVVLKEPYKTEWFLRQTAFMIIIVLFSFVMAIIAYRQNKKYENKQKKSAN